MDKLPEPKITQKYDIEKEKSKRKKQLSNNIWMNYLIMII